MTWRKRENARNWKRTLCVELALAGAMDLSYNRQQNEWSCHHEYILGLIISSVASSMWPRRKIKQNFHFSCKIICLKSFRFSFIIMSLKMATLCLNASLEILWPLCCRCMLCLKGDLCCCLHKGSPRALQAVVMLSARRVLQNSSQFTVQGFDVFTPQRPILGTDEGQKIPLQPLLSYHGLWGRNWVCWKTHFWPLKKVMLRCFTTPCSMSSW